MNRFFEGRERRFFRAIFGAAKNGRSTATAGEFCSLVICLTFCINRIPFWPQFRRRDNGGNERKAVSY